MVKNNSLKKKFEKFWNLSWGVKITLVLFFLFFVFEAIVQIVPFFWVTNNALKLDEQFALDPIGLTTTWSFANFIDVFKYFATGNVGYFDYLFNSVWQTSAYLLVNLTSSMFLAYAISKFNFPGRGFLFGLMIFTQTIPIIGAGAAAYKLRSTLGMINNPALIWLGWAMGFDYSAFIMYGTFKGISNSYAESAELDGASEFQIFGKVIFPLIFPCVVALLVTNFVGIWNDYTQSQLYLNKYPNMAYGLFKFKGLSSHLHLPNTNGIYFAALILAAIPGVLLYSCFQSVIIKNMTVGGLKG